MSSFNIKVYYILYIIIGKFHRKNKLKIIMNTNNINQIFQKVLKNLSIVGVSLSIFNTYSNQITVQSLRDVLENERNKNHELSMKINNLVTENESNDKIEIVLRKSLDDQGNKMDLLNNKINNMIDNKLFNETTVTDVKNTVKDVNKELLEIINKIDDCINNNFVDLNIFDKIITYINSLNYFQSLALSHLFTIILIFILLIDLMSVYFSDYLIENFNIKEKYPRIYKLLEIRRKFRIFYIIKDFIIIIVALIALAILNIMLFINFTL